MKRLKSKYTIANLLPVAILWLWAAHAAGQRVFSMDEDQRFDHFEEDSVQKEDVPEGIEFWQIDERFGDIVKAEPDTSMTLFQNDAFTSGRTGHYNFTGNFGAPRNSRLWFDNSADDMFGGFLFAAPYDYFLRDPSSLWYTNTKSPFTNLTYHECGNKQNGEDRLSALFATNVNKRLGFGFEADYLYGRGYYSAQNTSQIHGRIFGSYIGERYDLHTSFYTDYLKTAENGGLEDDTYVTNPELYSANYSEADLPMRLSKTWNRQRLTTFVLSHRYRIGMRRYRNTQGQIVHTASIGGKIGSKISTLTALPETMEKVDNITFSTDTLPLPKSALNNGIPADSLIKTVQKNEVELSLAERLRPDAPDSLRLTQEFVPVASLVHTLRVDADKREFRSNLAMNKDETRYFQDFYLPGDSASDRTHYTRVRNMLALEINEGFSRWMKAGLRVYASHEFERYTLPRLDLSKEKFSSHFITLGARIVSTRSRYFRYDAFGETRSDGKTWGEFIASACAEGSIPLFGDTLQVDLKGTLRADCPDLYVEHYHARNAWWDNEDFNKTLRSRLSGTLRWRNTSLSVGFEAIQNHIYFAETRQQTGIDNIVLFGVNAKQADKNIQVLSGTLSQSLALGIFRWQGELTTQLTSDKEILPLPMLNVYSNLYIDFRIARVLHTQIGADVSWFTKYYAPTYSPIIGQFAVQDAADRVKIGGYPIVNAYANFHLKRTRFYIMASHLNYSSGAGRPFLVPHYPLNRLVVRFGVSWNFIN